MFLHKAISFCHAITFQKKNVSAPKIMPNYVSDEFKIHKWQIFQNNCLTNGGANVFELAIHRLSHLVTNMFRTCLLHCLCLASVSWNCHIFKVHHCQFENFGITKLLVCSDYVGLGGQVRGRSCCSKPLRTVQRLGFKYASIYYPQCQKDVRTIQPPLLPRSDYVILKILVGPFQLSQNLHLFHRIYLKVSVWLLLFSGSL